MPYCPGGCKNYLRLTYPAEPAMNIWMLNSSWLDMSEVRIGISILIYGVYNAHNSIRHSDVSDSMQAYHCIVQHCKQGAFGHSELMAYLDSAWRRPVRHFC
jgi:hypothetical protein